MTPRVLLTNAQKLDRLVTEDELMDYVTTLLTLHHWLWYHTHDSRRSNPGFPDIVAVKNGFVLFIELKRETGKVSESQQRWLDALGEADAWDHHEAVVWRPSDMRAIAERLRF